MLTMLSTTRIPYSKVPNVGTSTTTARWVGSSTQRRCVTSTVIKAEDKNLIPIRYVGVISGTPCCE
jgi:hypothetical protein